MIDSRAEDPLEPAFLPNNHALRERPLSYKSPFGSDGRIFEYFTTCRAMPSASTGYRLHPSTDWEKRAFDSPTQKKKPDTAFI
jgi:hypothetical protein